MKNTRPIPVRPQPAAVPYVARAAFAAFIAKTKARGSDPAAIAESLFPDDEVTPILLNRAAVDGASTTGWASGLVQSSYQAFLTSLAPISAASRLIPLGLSVSFDGSQTITIPSRQGSPLGLPWVAERGAIPVRSYSLQPLKAGPPKKFAAIIVLTAELAKRSAAETMFRAMLEEDAAASLDAAYFGSQAESSAGHPGLLNGVTPIVASSASGQEAMRADLAAVIASVATGGSGQVVIVTSLGRAATMSLFAPELDVQVLGSSAVPDDRVIAIDPRSLFHALDGKPDIDASDQATLDMNTDPAQQIMETGGPLQAMFQTGQIAVRVIGEVAFGKRRPGAVAFVDGVNWGAAG